MMEQKIFEMAFGLESPWYIKSVEFSDEEKRLDVYIDFKRGGKFSCGQCGGEEEYGAYDTQTKTWRHLNFFQYMTYIHARVPRIKCKDHGIKLVSVPWARKKSGFTLLFEGLIMTMAKHMAIKTIANMIGETDTRIWRIIEHYVVDSLEKEDYREVTQVGIDETAVKRGHEYVSLFVDLKEKKVIHICEGKGSEGVNTFVEKIKKRNGDITSITDVSCDMSPAFIKGVEEYLPEARITFDKFHVMKLMNKAVDEVRKEERKTESELKNTRYIWLKNPENLTEKQNIILKNIEKLHTKTARAYQIKLAFQDIFKQTPENGEESLKAWYSWAIRSRLKPVVDFAKTVKRHWEGIVRWFKSRINNGILEGLNSIVQTAKAKARGFRSFRYFAYCIYLVAGKLEFNLPT